MIRDNALDLYENEIIERPFPTQYYRNNPELGIMEYYDTVPIIRGKRKLMKQKEDSAKVDFNKRYKKAYYTY